MWEKDSNEQRKSERESQEGDDRVCEAIGKIARRETLLWRKNPKVYGHSVILAHILF